MKKSDVIEHEKAWRSYYANLEAMRAKIYGVEWIDKPRAREAANYLLFQVQAAAFNMVIGPKRDYPSLSLNTTYPPILYSLSNPGADHNYRFGFVDGARSYRIWGKRGGSRFVDIQVNNVIWGTSGARKVANCDLDKIELGPDGSFELIASGTPQSGNWLQLDPASSDNLLLVREIFGDWAKPRAEFNIELIDDGRPRKATLAAEELVRRLAIAENYIRFYVWDWAGELTTRTLSVVGPNKMYPDIFTIDQGAGNHPSGVYPCAVYDLGDEEAILIETDIADARYWNVQLCDPFWQVVEFTYHQSSLNMNQAKLDADGKFRAIISRRDPGIANWLDPVDNPFGALLFRFFGMERRVNPEVVLRGSLKEVLRRLPVDTAMVTPEERASILSQRAIAARARFRD
jgi:hypothetical protein